MEARKMSVSELRRQYEQRAAEAPQPKKAVSPAHKKAKAKKIFDKFDTDGSGDIDVTEFQVLAFELGLALTDTEAAEFVKEIDRDGNGTIDFEEFYAWWASDKKLDTNSPERAKQLQILRIKLQSKALLKNAAVVTNALAKEVEKATKLSDHSINSYDMEFLAGEMDKVNTSVSWTHTVSAEAAAKIREQAKTGDQSLVVVLNVSTKAGVDPFELGEIGGSVKSILDMAKGELHYSDFSTGFLKEGNKNLFQLFFTFTPAELPQLVPINAIVDALRISKFSLLLESSDGIGVDTQGFPNSRMAVKLELNRNVLLELANSLPPDQKKGLIGLAALRKVHFSMAFENFTKVLTPDLFPEQFTPDKVHTFKEIRQLIVPMIAEVLTNEQLPGQFVELYETCLHLLSGIDSIQIALGSNVFTLQFEGLNIFDGFLPNSENLRRIRDAVVAPPGLHLFNVVAATDGGEISGFELYGVTQQVPTQVYSSTKQKNVNIVFAPATDEPHTLAAVIVRNPGSGFTSPLKHALLWVLPSFDATPNFSQFDKYDDYTREQFEADTSDTKPLAFIEVPATGAVQIPLEKWGTGKAFFVKMLNAHGADNIDVEFIGFVGFLASGAPAERKVYNPAQAVGVGGVPALPLADYGVDF